MRFIHPDREEETVDSREFYDQASQPDFPDTMAFEINRPEGDDNPETGFSRDGIEGLSMQMAAFMAARSLAHYKRTGAMPKKASIVVSVRLDGQDAKDGIFPYYTVVDGEHREAT